MHSLQQAVAWAGFGIGFVLGAVSSRTGFCTMGALSDVVHMGEWTRLRMWLFAIGVAVLGTQALAWSGTIDLTRALHVQPALPWLSLLTGGVLFGFGMTLASGCGARTLTRVGAGSLKAMVVLAVMSLFAYMTLRGVFGVLRAGVLDPIALQLPQGQDLPRLIAGAGATPASVATMRVVAGGIIGAGLLAVALAGREFRRPGPLLGAACTGLAVVAAWAVSAHLGYVAEDPQTLQERFVGSQSGRPEALSFVGPVAFSMELLMFWSDPSRRVTMGIASVAGMIAGSLAHALATRSFRWEGFAGVQDTARHLVGAAMMGVGGVTAMGCTIGQGITGVSTLSMGSMIALAGIVAGALCGFRWLGWQEERQLATTLSKTGSQTSV